MANEKIKTEFNAPTSSLKVHAVFNKVNNCDPFEKQLFFYPSVTL